MKISANIYFYPGLQPGAKSYSNSIIIQGKKQILIDPGTATKEHLAKLNNLIEKDGLKLENTKEIWLTHAHPDHAQGAGDLHSRYGSKICAHPLACEILEAKKPLEELIKRQLKKIDRFESFWQLVKDQKLIFFKKREAWVRKLGPLARFLSFLAKIAIIPARILFFFPSSIVWIVEKVLEKIFGRWFQIPIHRRFEDKEIIENDPDIQILFLPGHSPEEIGFWIEKEKTLITGDLIQKSKKFPMLISPNSDFKASLCSLERISDLNPEILIPAHGEFVIGKEQIKSLIIEIRAEMQKIQSIAKDLLNRSSSQDLIDTLAEHLPENLSITEKISCARILSETLK